MSELVITEVFDVCTNTNCLFIFCLRREKLALQYFTKLQSCPSNPAFECTINLKYKELFARKESAIPSFGIRMQSVLDNSNTLNENVHETVIPEVPP